MTAACHSVGQAPQEGGWASQLWTQAVPRAWLPVVEVSAGSLGQAGPDALRTSSAVLLGSKHIQRGGALPLLPAFR